MSPRHRSLLAHCFAVPVAVAAATLLAGCLAVGPYATVKVIESYEQATGRSLDGRPLPTPTDAATIGAPGETAGAGGAAGDAGTPTGTPGAETPAPTPPVATPAVITLNMFNQLQAGMTYTEIVKILGRDGQLLPNSRTKIYVWYNANSSFVRVVFSGDRMADKEQQRLS